MTLVNKTAKDMERLIKGTDFDPIATKQKLDFFLERNRITFEEYTYLVDLMEAELNKQVEEALKRVK
ncbi:hypothetical protein [Paraclostridium dentum]|uniref:hypothetical protein n=1 Tax=Paraclostridium dentum TaxID=2662455 RepID=UPI003F2FB139